MTDTTILEVDVPPRKVHISIRIDADVVQFFKARGDGPYQAQMNAVLRAFMHQTLRQSHKEGRKGTAGG